MKTEAFAPAKVNLTLHVTGQRTDGYHLLDSLVAFADIGDRITATQPPNPPSRSPARLPLACRPALKPRPTRGHRPTKHRRAHA